MKDEIIAWAKEYGGPELGPLTLGIIECESSFDPFAVRYESSYRWTKDVTRYASLNFITPITELTLQQMSLGLMQVMGSTYRDMGYNGPLTAIFYDHKLSIVYGVKYIKWLIQRLRTDDHHRVISAYNAGPGNAERGPGGRFPNQTYVDRVLAAEAKYKGDFLVWNQKPTTPD